MVTFLKVDLGSSSRTKGALLRVFMLCLATACVAACGERNKEKPATQTAAKVNKEEITVHQINYVLGQQRALPPDQAASATRQVLEHLIDQQLELQKAGEQKLDRDPRVVQQIEAARREIVARAYLEKIAQGAPKPTPQEVNAYYEAHPALFRQRRVYSLQELVIQATPEQTESLKTTLARSKTFGDFVAFLKSNNYKFTAGEAVRAAEQLPLASVDQFAEMKDGQAIFRATPMGAQVINIAASRMEPVSQQQAVAAIEQYLLNERKRKLIADDLRALRSSAKIDYIGDFAKDRPKPLVEPPSASMDTPPLTTIAPPNQSAPVLAAPQVDVAPLERPAASMPSGATLDRGLKGMK